MKAFAVLLTVAAAVASAAELVERRYKDAACATPTTANPSTTTTIPASGVTNIACNHQYIVSGTKTTNPTCDQFFNCVVNNIDNDQGKEQCIVAITGESAVSKGESTNKEVFFQASSLFVKTYTYGSSTTCGGSNTTATVTLAYGTCHATDTYNIGSSVCTLYRKWTMSAASHISAVQGSLILVLLALAAVSGL